MMKMKALRGKEDEKREKRLRRKVEKRNEDAGKEQFQRGQKNAKKQLKVKRALQLLDLSFSRSLTPHGLRLPVQPGHRAIRKHRHRRSSETKSHLKTRHRQGDKATKERSAKLNEKKTERAKDPSQKDRTRQNEANS